MTETPTRYATPKEDEKHFTLSPEEAATLPGRILAILVENHRTGERITAMQLAKHLGYRDDRNVRLAIDLLLDKGYCIVSSVRGRKGYYLADDQADIDQCVATQVSRGRENFERARKIKRNAERWLGQQLQWQIVDQVLTELER